MHIFLIFSKESKDDTAWHYINYFNQAVHFRPYLYRLQNGKGGGVVVVLAIFLSNMDIVHKNGNWNIFYGKAPSTLTLVPACIHVCYLEGLIATYFLYTCSCF